MPKPIFVFLSSAAFVVLTVLVSNSPTHAQTFNVLYVFGTNPQNDPRTAGETPELTAQGRDGNLYGTTYRGGTNDEGAIFKITPSGELNVIYSFNGTDGANPFSGLVLGTDGNFYGATYRGGTGNLGTVFKVTPSGVLTTLYNFSGVDGSNPEGPPVQGGDGNLYGTTRTGGTSNYGTVYKLTPSGKLTVLHQFDFSDGALPYSNLVQATDGNFYGTTFEGGTGMENGGTAYRITPSGTFAVIYNFTTTNGSNPVAALIQASDGNFYGSTTSGGSGTHGTLFRLTTKGVLTVIHAFDDPSSYLSDPLLQASDGNLYAKTSVQGVPTVFSIDLTGNNFKAIFDEFGQAGSPNSVLCQDTSGIFYGETYNDSLLLGYGVFYSLDNSLPPFAGLVSTAAKVGASVGILGQGFTGTTSVSFNGFPANFKVSGDTFVAATVPSGATTGFVTVTSPSGKLKSLKTFRVTPQVLSFSPTSGPVGQQVTITGVSLTQTNGVGFGDRVPAKFTVKSDTMVTATVPSGAKTGPVGVQTKGGTAISKQIFTVTQ